MRLTSILPIAVITMVMPAAHATELKPETARAWDQYIVKTNADMRQRLNGSKPFLWIDEAPEHRARLRQGEILAEPVNGRGLEHVPEGLVYDWVGAVFIPQATIKEVYAVLNDYERYDEFYDPTVVAAKLLEDNGEKQRFSMVLMEKASFVTAAVQSEYESRKTRIDQRHSYSVAYSTRIQEIQDYGKTSQQVLPPDQGNGFMWRLYSIQRFEEKDGGVYAEFEAIALSRDIPFALRWIVKPIVQRLPRTSMVATLEKTRQAVCASRSVKIAEANK